MSFEFFYFMILKSDVSPQLWRCIGALVLTHIIVGIITYSTSTKLVSTWPKNSDFSIFISPIIQCRKSVNSTCFFLLEHFPPKYNLHQSEIKVQGAWCKLDVLVLCAILFGVLWILNCPGGQSLISLDSTLRLYQFTTAKLVYMLKEGGFAADSRPIVLLLGFSRHHRLRERYYREMLVVGPVQTCLIGVHIEFHYKNNT